MVMERSGHVCPEYMRRLSAAERREEIFRILCDVNGGAWLMEMHARGVSLPVNDFREEFKSFINGGYTMEYPQGYTSELYCGYEGDVIAHTTLIYAFLSALDVDVPANTYPTLILSAGSTADIVLHPTARLNIELYGDASYRLSGDQTRVNVKKH